MLTLIKASEAAEQGYPGGQLALAALYESGEGVPQDYAEALKWYRLAADQGVVEAQNQLGVMYATGQGVSQDFVRAYMWFSLSAARNDGIAASNRDRIAQQMTPSQIAEAKKLADEWNPTSASARF